MKPQIAIGVETGRPIRDADIGAERNRISTGHLSLPSTISMSAKTMP
jgi:hypothetical protein